MNYFFQDLKWKIESFLDERYKTERLRIHRGIREKYEEWYKYSVLCDILYILFFMGIIVEIFVSIFSVNPNSIIYKIPLFQYIYEMDFLDLLISLALTVFVTFNDNSVDNSTATVHINLSGFIYLPIIFLILYGLFSNRPMNLFDLKSFGIILIISCILSIPFILILV